MRTIWTKIAGGASISIKRVFLLMVLFPSALYAAAPLPPTAKVVSLDDFSGGLDTLHPTNKVQPSFSPFIRNLFVDEGQMKTPNGFTVLGSSMILQKVSGIFPYALENGSVFYLVTDSSYTLETQDFKSWVFVSSGSNSGTLLNWFQVRNKMWGVNGVDFPITWDHTTKTILNGSGNTPAAPKFRYGEYFLDRVWGFNVPGAASDLYWSTTITTDNVIIAPDDSRAWLDTRNISHVGQGDGQIGTALWPYDGRLRIGKERSIYTLYGDNPSNFNPIKQEGQVGVVSDESIALLDQKSYWVGQDGIYENSNRISDLIKPDVATFKKSQSSILSNVWETKGDFDRGQYVFNSTSTSTGFLNVFYGDRVIAWDPSFSQNPASANLTRLTNGTPSAGFSVFTPTITIENNALFNMKSWRVWYLSSGDNTTEPIVGWTIKNTRTNEISSFSVLAGNLGQTINFAQPSNNSGAYINNSLFNSTISFRGSDFNAGNIQIKVNLQNVMTRDYVDVSFTDPAGSSMTLMAQTTGQFISDVATISMVTAWGNFDSLNNTNGGSISFFERTSTSVVNITTKTWTLISPGSTINEPTINNFIQWSATMSGIISPSVDNVSISHVEGQISIQRPIAIDWNNRIWISVSTQADVGKRELYVKSLLTNKTPSAWMPLDGIDVCAFARLGTVFYGGSCSTGTIYRLDYGTNYNGSAIQSIYKTPQLNFGAGYFDNEIYKYLLQGNKNTNGIIAVNGLVEEGSKGVTSSTFSVNGTGAFNQIIEGVRNKGKTLDLTVSEKDLDQPMTLQNVSVIYEPTQVLSNK